MLLSYRRVFVVILMAAAVSAGCRPAERKYEGPTVPAFTGRLTHKGEPVSFPGEGRVVLQLMFEKGKGPMGVRIQPDDGTFKVGSMAIGKYSMTLIRGNNMYNIPDVLTIEEGKTEYEIELGKKWNPSVSGSKKGG